jgi:predicted DCC family thiol-disulfide oxidoreductase YuxK
MQTNATGTIVHDPEQPDAAVGWGPLVPRPVLLYSATCRFCRWAARVVTTLDRREQLALLPLATEEAAQLLAAVPESRRTESWWLVRRDGTLVAGKNGGAVVLLTAMPPTSWLASLLMRTGLTPLVNWLEALIARHRGSMSRFVPDGPAPRRFP